MTRLRTIPVIAVVIAGLAASSAAARPIDGPAYYDAGHASTAVAKAQDRLSDDDAGYATAVSSASERTPQDLRSPDTRDAAIRPNLAPVFPTYPELDQRPATVATVSTPDDDLPVWPIAGVATLLIGLAGASLVGRRHHARLGT